MPKDAVDVAAIERLCPEYLDAGAKGIVALGTTGEASRARRSARARGHRARARARARRGAPLIVGTGTNNTRSTIGASRAVAGTDAVVGVLVVVPYYVRPSEAGVVAHMQAVADASELPVVLYNIPYRTGRGLSAPRLLELAAHPNIAGVKQAVGALDADTLQLLADAPPGFSVLGGEDPFLFPIVCMGGAGRDRRVRARVHRPRSSR